MSFIAGDVKSCIISFTCHIFSRAYFSATQFFGFRLFDDSFEQSLSISHMPRRASRRESVTITDETSSATPESL